MMDSQFLQPAWPAAAAYNPCGSLAHPGLYSFPMDDPCQFSSSFLSGDSSSGISFDSYLAAMTASPDTLLQLPSFDTISHMWTDETLTESDGNISSQLTCESDSWSPQEQSNPCLMLPVPGVNISMDDHRVWLNHLLRAYGEAVGNGHPELAEVIVRRINEKMDPLGEPMERVAFNLFQSRETQGGNYLRQQSGKNREEAFETFYQWYPYGRFAHFTANSSILQAMPRFVDTIHIVDFDMGEGIQWPPLIEAMSRGTKSALRITSVRHSDDDDEDPLWNFEDTKRRLCSHASAFGVNLRVEEMELGDLVREIKGTKNRGGASEWLAFNLMVALPHMGRQRDRGQVAEFLTVAKDLLPYSDGSRGIITFGDGESGDDYSSTCPEYSSFFNNRLKHFQGLFESMECDFPVYLPEARIAMETLFLSPYLSSHSWFQQWKGTNEAHALAGLEGWRMSRESLMEAKQIANQRESSYQVFLQGGENEMVLKWKSIPLVRVSCWT